MLNTLGYAGEVSGLFVPLHFRSCERKVYRENFRSRGTFVPWNIRSRGAKSPGTFVSLNFRTPGTLLLNKWAGVKWGAGSRTTSGVQPYATARLVVS